MKKKTKHWVLLTTLLFLVPAFLQAHTNAPVGTPDGTSLQSCDVRIHEDGRDPRNPIVGSLRHRIKQFNESTNDVLVSRCLFYISFLDPASFSIHSPLIITGGNHSYTRRDSAGRELTPACSASDRTNCLYRGVQIIGGRDHDDMSYPEGDYRRHGLPVTIDATEFTQNAESECAFKINLIPNLESGGAWHQITNIRILAGRRDKAICDLSGRDISSSPAFRTATVIPSTPSGTPPPPPPPTAPTCSFLPPRITETDVKLKWELGEGSDEVSLDAGSESIDLGRCNLVGHSCFVPRSVMDVTYTLMVQNRTTGSTGTCSSVITGSRRTMPLDPLGCDFPIPADAGGGNVRLHWNVTNPPMDRTQIQIREGMCDSTTVSDDRNTMHLAMGDLTVPASDTTCYTLSVTRPEDGASCRSTVRAQGPRASIPQVACTLAWPARIGGGYDLTWTTTNPSSAMDAVTLNMGNVMPNASLAVNPTTPTTYTLRARGVDGGGSCERSITLPLGTFVPPPTPTCTLPTPTSHAGGGFDLTWTSTNGTAELSDGRTVLSSQTSRTSADPLVVNPASLTTYTLTVTSPAGLVCSRALFLSNTGRASGEGPTCTLNAPVARAGSAGGYDITWSTTRANSASLSDGGRTPLATDLNRVAASPLPVPRPTEIKTYTLSAMGDGGTCSQSFLIGPDRFLNIDDPNRGLGLEDGGCGCRIEGESRSMDNHKNGIPFLILMGTLVALRFSRRYF